MYIAVVLSRFTLLYVKFLELAKLKLYPPPKKRSTCRHGRLVGTST